MSQKTPAQEWAELENEMAGLVSRSYREIAALVEKLPDAFLMREGRTIRSLLAAGDEFMAKLHDFMEEQIRAAVARERERQQQPQPKRTA